MTVVSHKWFAVFSIVVASIVTCSVYYGVSRNGYSDVYETTTQEAATIVGLTTGFVEAYSEITARYSPNHALPTPAEFRANALHFAKDRSFAEGLHTSVVGLPGREIRLGYTDELMKQQLIQLAERPQQQALTSVYRDESRTHHRTLWPFFATASTCADCHNRIQNLHGDARWKVGDLIGVQVIDQRIDSQLTTVTQRSLWFAILSFCSLLAAVYCYHFVYQQYMLSQKLRKLATTDSMTGCINRREMYSRVSAIKGPANGALLMLDLDHFKRINDSYGHDAGDAVISDFSKRIMKALRNDDWVARIGGEEFIVWLPAVKPAAALLVAERVRKDCEISPLLFNDIHIQYTVSIGLHIVEDAAPSRIDLWIKAADQLLYRAKNEGRNRIVFQRELMA